MVAQSLVLGLLTMVTYSMTEGTPPQLSFWSTSNTIIKAMESLGHRFAFPHNDNFTCIQSNASDCCRLEFRIKSDAHLTISARVFFHLSSVFGRNVSVTWPFVTEEAYSEKEFMYFDTTQCLKSVRRNVLHCSIEVTGVAVAEVSKHIPFLMVSNNGQSRRRRATSTCSVRNHYVATKDLGMGHAHPETINIKTCAGECPITFRSFKSHYSRTMYLFHKRNRLDIPDKSWKPMCHITGMGSIHLIFNNTEGNGTMYEEKVVENIVVTSCGCRTHNCSA